MASKIYDAIVVGARVAGSPTAMLLARKGYDVLLVDRATFPSDTISTHIVHPPGIEALKRWGLLDSLVDRVSRHRHLCRRLWTLYARGCTRPRDCRIRPAANVAGQAAARRRGPGRRGSPRRF
jgi:2-polyprenyl-6-methoxyphenol hydroxylase-like FAD-dependent oxidoreductase